MTEEVKVNREGQEPTLGTREQDGAREAAEALVHYIQERINRPNITLESNKNIVVRARSHAYWSAAISNHPERALRLLEYIDDFYGPLNPPDMSPDQQKDARIIFRQEMRGSFLLGKGNRSITGFNIFAIIAYGIAKREGIGTFQGRDRDSLGSILAREFGCESLGELQEAATNPLVNDLKVVAQFIRQQPPDRFLMPQGHSQYNAA